MEAQAEYAGQSTAAGPLDRYYEDPECEALANTARWLRRLLDAGAIVGEEHQAEARKRIERIEHILEQSQGVIREDDA